MELLVLTLVSAAAGFTSAAAAADRLAHIESPLQGMMHLARAPNASDDCLRDLNRLEGAIANKEFWALKSKLTFFSKINLLINIIGF